MPAKLRDAPQRQMPMRLQHRFSFVQSVGDLPVDVKTCSQYISCFWNRTSGDSPRRLKTKRCLKCHDEWVVLVLMKSGWGLTCWFARQGERAITVLTNTEEDSTARPSESRILIADACPISLRPNAVVILSFTFKPRVCKDVFWQRSWLLGACFSRRRVSAGTAKARGQGSSPQNKHIGESALWANGWRRSPILGPTEEQLGLTWRHKDERWDR